MAYPSSEWAALAVALALAMPMSARAQNLAPGGAAPEYRRPIGPVPGPGTAPERDSSPYARDAAALMEGRRLFTQFNCAGCHGGHGGGGMGPSLRDKVWIYGGKGSEIYDSIVEGRPHGMPAWGPRLSRDQVWKLVAYLESMRTEREPQPPR